MKDKYIFATLVDVSTNLHGCSPSHSLLHISFASETWNSSQLIDQRDKMSVRSPFNCVWHSLTITYTIRQRQDSTSQIKEKPWYYIQTWTSSIDDSYKNVIADVAFFPIVFVIVLHRKTFSWIPRQVMPHIHLS